MKRTTILLLSLILIYTSCQNDDDFPTHEPNGFLVSKVYDYQDRLLADYLYNEQGQLVKRMFTDPVTGYASDLLFFYGNGRLAKIDYVDHDFPGFNYTILLNYNDANDIARSEVWKEGSMINHINYAYGPSGNVSHFYKDNGLSYNYFEYDGHGNVKTVTNSYEDPYTGETIVTVRTFNYDERERPSFNLDYLFQIDLLPKMGSDEIFERNLSSNNMTFFENSGTNWTYEFNNEGLPISILTEFEGIDTEEPMLLKLEYIEE